ncbi:MAG: DUF29 domain-containing protein [Bryobacteraceae bacterium]|nr:DUF29 domain-containing protein [Bryobacteraceae bacterium]
MASPTATANPASANAELYHADGAAWAEETAQLLRERRFDEIDFDALVEEVEGLSQSNHDQADNRAGVLIAHILKWRYQPERRSRSWIDTIAEQQFRIKKLFKRYPSVRRGARLRWEETWADGRELALDQTGLPKKAIPAEPDMTLDECLDAKFRLDD